MFESESSMPLPKPKPGVQMEVPMSRSGMIAEQQAQQQAMSIDDQSA
jgi:hypothetical protein